MDKIEVTADVKFHSQMPFTTVDVCFRSRDELGAFIAALQRLLDAPTSEVQLYLSDSSAGDSDIPDSLPTDVCFHPPGFVRDEIDLRCLGAARSHLESLLKDAK